MSILKYFKNTPGRPHRATGPKCNFFFFKFAMRSMEKKRGLSPPPSGDHWAQPTGAARGPVASPPRRRQGACRPPSGDRGNPPI